MNEFLPHLLHLSVGCVVGLVVGTVVFGGLWMTTRRLVTSQHPGLLALVSLVGRMGVLGLGMFLVAQVGAVALIAAACGTLAVRQWMFRQVQFTSRSAS